MLKGLIVTGGKVSIDQVKKLTEETLFDIIIGVDHGIDYLYEAEIDPELIVGDFDSCNHERLDYYNKKGIKRIEFPTEKDITDTNLAFDIAVELGISELIVLGATGSRVDHSLGNIMILTGYIDKINIVLLNPNNRIRVINKQITLSKSNYDYVSILPVGGDAYNVTFKGVKYPLEDANLRLQNSFGISNEIIEDKARLSVGEGMLIVIESRD